MPWGVSMTLPASDHDARAAGMAPPERAEIERKARRANARPPWRDAHAALPLHMLHDNVAARRVPHHLEHFAMKG